MERFARRLETAAPVVRSFNGDIEANRQHVLDKEWDEKELEVIIKTPSLLMIKEDFDNFSPRLHPWIQVNFGENFNEGLTGVYKYGETLEKLADAVKQDQKDIFEAVNDVINEVKLSSVGKIFEAKPGIFGISIDLYKGKDILATLIRRMSRPKVE